MNRNEWGDSDEEEQSQEMDVFCRRWSLTTNHVPSRDPNYMLTFRNTTSSALRKSPASATAVNSDMLHISRSDFDFIFARCSKRRRMPAQSTVDIHAAVI